ncbi:PH domain-containing protein [Streptomyces sp. NPDC006367]|uniref:PH domain-containing protein n=1 Tax=unclassified Streptomyces TaxID=2593676 RepID=UPI0033A2D422
MTTSRSERRRRAGRERRARQERLAARAVAPDRPLVWRAGRGGRIAGAACYLLFALYMAHPGPATPGALFFAAWSSLVAAWVCCRLALWRVTADRDGVYVRRMWSTRFLRWSVISRVDLRHDGVLEFTGPESPLLTGMFAPPWLSRLTGRSESAGEAAADTLTVMAAHEHLRPTAKSPSPTRTGFALWAVPLGLTLLLTTALGHL